MLPKVTCFVHYRQLDHLSFRAGHGDFSAEPGTFGAASVAALLGRLALGCHVCAVFFSPRPRLGSITVQSQPIVHTGIALLFCFITTTCWAWSLHSCDRYCSFFPINTRSLSHGDPAGRAAVWSGSSGSSMAMNVSKTSSALGRPPGSSSQACTQSASKT